MWEAGHNLTLLYWIKFIPLPSLRSILSFNKGYEYEKAPEPCFHPSSLGTLHWPHWGPGPPPWFLSLLIPTGRFCFSSRSCSPVTVSQLWPGLYMWQLCRIPPSVSFSNPCYVSKLIWWLQQCPTHNSFISTTDRVHPVLLDISEFPMTQDTSAVSSKDPANPNAPNQCHLLSRGFWYPWSVTCPNSHQGHKLDTMESPSNPFPAITGDGIVWS